MLLQSLTKETCFQREIFSVFILNNSVRHQPTPMICDNASSLNLMVQYAAYTSVIVNLEATVTQATRTVETFLILQFNR